MMLGPALSFVSVFVVNLILALLGHGGITAVGINTLTIGIEAALGEPCLNILSKFGGTASAAILRCLHFCCHSSYNIVSKFNWCGRYGREGLLHTQEHEDHGSEMWFTDWVS